MNINQLKNFIAVAQSLNITSVAKSAYISQPALTKQISRLESEINIQLFERTKNGLALTYAGEEFYKYAVDIIDELNQAENRMMSIRNGNEGFLKVSAVYSMEKITAGYVESFSNLYDRVSVNIFIGSGISQINTIRKQTYDIFFSFQDLLSSFPDVLTMTLPPDRFALFISKNHAGIFRKEGFDYLNSLKHFVEISSEGPYLTSKTFALMDELNLNSKNIVYYPSSTAMFTAVQAGLGFALLPLEIMFGLTPENIEVIPLDIPKAKIERAVGWFKESEKSITLKNFLNVIRTALQPADSAPTT